MSPLAVSPGEHFWFAYCRFGVAFVLNFIYIYCFINLLFTDFFFALAVVHMIHTMTMIIYNYVIVSVYLCCCCCSYCKVKLFSVSAFSCVPYEIWSMSVLWPLPLYMTRMILFCSMRWLFATRCASLLLRSYAALCHCAVLSDYFIRVFLCVCVC